MTAYINLSAGECPVDPDARVLVAYRDQTYSTLPRRAGDLRWTDEDLPDDIMAYKISDAVRTVENAEPPVRTTEQYLADKADGIERIGKPEDQRKVPGA